MAIHPGAGNAIKRWMPERFATVAAGIAKRTGARVVVLSGPGEEALGAPMLRALPAGKKLDLRGKLDLPQMAALLERAKLFIGNDGGPAHVAAAAGTPSLIVFSGTSVAAEWAPRGARVLIVRMRLDSDCLSSSSPITICRYHNRRTSTRNNAATSPMRALSRVVCSFRYSVWRSIVGF